MAWEMKVDGMAELSNLLSQMEEKAPSVAASALYEGAGIMSDAIVKGAKSIRTAPFKFVPEGHERLPSPEEKAAVVDAGAGIARFDKNGTEVNTSVGYANTGYTEIKGRRKPIPLIANSINSGTSFMKKQPFVRKAANSGGKKAIAAMTASIEEAFGAMTK